MSNIDSKRSYFIEWSVVVGLLSAVAAPSIPLPGYRVNMTALMAPFVLVQCFASLRGGYLQAWSGLWLVCAMGAAVIISTMWSYIGLAVPFNGADFAEAYKYFQFVPYLVALQFVNRSKFENVMKRCVSIAGLIVISVGLIQLIYPGMGSAISSLFGANDLQIASMTGQRSRLLMTGPNANVGAAIGVFFLVYYSVKFVSSKKILDLAISMILLILVFETQSRTAIVGVLVATVVYGFVFSGARLVVRVITICCLISAGFFLARHLDLQYVIAGVQQTRDGDNVSLNIRLDNLMQAWEWFQSSPVLGWGPAKSIHSTIIDSEYALILERYGTLGVIIYVMYIIMHIRKSYRVIAMRVDSYGFHRCSLIYMIFGVVLMATNNLFSGYQLMALVILLLCNVRVVEISRPVRDMSRN